MNISLRKLVLLESQLIKQEEEAKVLGYSSCPIDKEFKDRITKLIDKVRY